MRKKTMAANRKLTPLLTGRTVATLSQFENHLSILFGDGSTLSIKTAGPVADLDFQSRTVLKVRQTGAVLNLDFSDASTAEIRLAEAMSSVMLRDGRGTLEYAD
jgi:hypothetical protein